MLRDKALVVIKNNTSTPKMYFNPVSCHLMFFSHKIKLKTTCSASSQIIDAFENKISYESGWWWLFCFLHLNYLFKQCWRIYSQSMSFAIVKANISTVWQKKRSFDIMGQKQD